jgi:hypothetical protein
VRPPSEYYGVPWQATAGQARDLGNDTSPLAILHRALSVFSCCCGTRVKRKDGRPSRLCLLRLRSLGGTFRTWGNRGTVLALTRLWNAVAALAGRLEALASTVGTIEGELRQRIGLIEPADVQVLEHTPAPAVEGHGAAADAGNSRSGRLARGRK